MRLWFCALSSEVPIYRQLKVTQVVLAILWRATSSPAIACPARVNVARRFALHPNTVKRGLSSAWRRGRLDRAPPRCSAGISVRANSEPPSSTPAQRIDHHIAGFFRAARDLGLPAQDVRARVPRVAWPRRRPITFLLIDPDPELRRILLS